MTESAGNTTLPPTAQPYQPQDSASGSWEADILKLRGLELLLVLLYVEDLKRSILGSIKTTDRLLKRGDRLSIQPEQDRGPFETARDILVAEGVISKADGDELLSLVDYRSVVGDGLLHLNADIGAFSALIRFNPGGSQPDDHTAVRRLRAMRKRVFQRMKQRYVPPSAHDVLHFETAERTILTEIARLKRHVSHGLRRSIHNRSGPKRVTGRQPKPEPT